MFLKCDHRVSLAFEVYGLRDDYRARDITIKLVHNKRCR